jgi:hypothetical protein
MKTKLIGFLFILNCTNLLAQNAVNNMQKYVYYKQRFLNNFIAVGNGMGESLPMDIRRLEKQNTTNGQWVHEFGLSDASLRLGWYIAVLATEYKLLNVQGLDTYQTRKELYYALEAINRLDLNAESYFNLAGTNTPNQAINPSSDDLNGFFIRDDMPDNFIDSTYLIDPYNVNNITNIFQNFTSTNTIGHPHLKTSPQSNIYMSGARGEFNQFRNSPTIDDAHKYKDEMSQDQIFDLFLGLALVKKCVDPGANFNNLTMADDTVSFYYEAINITNRIINRVVEDEFILKNQSDYFSGECTVTPNYCNDPNNWINSNTNNYFCENNCMVGDASNMRLLGYGAVKAASFITGRSVLDIYGTQYLRKPRQEAMWNLLGSDPIRVFIGFTDKAKHEWKFLTALAAVGGEWENCNVTSILNINDFLNDVFNNPFPEIDPDIYFYSAFASDQFTFSVNNVEERLRFFTHNFAFNEIEYLIYCFLHNDSPNWTGDNTINFEALMDEAPCMGPYFYGIPVSNNGNNYDPHPGFNWSKPSRWKSGYDLTVHSPTDQDNGEYSGLDYMLLFNMFCLLNPGYASYNFEANNEVIPASQYYPYNFMYPGLLQPPWAVVASNINPSTKIGFETITSSATVLYINSNFYGNMTYKAGKQIHLTSGFNVQRGAKFHAVINPLTCDNSHNYRAASNNLIWENGGDDNPIPLSTKISKSPAIPKKPSNNNVLNLASAKTKHVADIKVYPNPSEGTIHISISEGSMIKKIQLFDLIGNLIDEKIVSEKQITMEYNTVTNGSYLLKITDAANKVYHKKIILE